MVFLAKYTSNHSTRINVTVQRVDFVAKFANLNTRVLFMPNKTTNSFIFYTNRNQERHLNFSSFSLSNKRDNTFEVHFGNSSIIELASQPASYFSRFSKISRIIYIIGSLKRDEKSCENSKRLEGQERVQRSRWRWRRRCASNQKGRNFVLFFELFFLLLLVCLVGLAKNSRHRDMYFCRGGYLVL